MKNVKVKCLKAVGFALAVFAVGALFSSPAKAALTQAIDIKVSISATKSVAVNTTHYNFGALTVNTSSVSATAITVTNDSAALVETYTLQGANAASTGGGTTWNIAASTGVVDEYVLGAQFSTARPANTDSAFTNDVLTTSAIVASAGTLGNTTLGESGASVSPLAGSNTRSLWFRIITPLAVSDVTQRNATLTLAIN